MANYLIEKHQALTIFYVYLLNCFYYVYVRKSTSHTTLAQTEFLYLFLYRSGRMKNGHFINVE